MANKTEWPKLPKLPKEALTRLSKCLALVPDRKLKQEEAPCVMGGKPPLPEGVDWPEQAGELLTYVGRINTNVAHELFEEVPAAGWLLFFHDPDDERLQTVLMTEELGEPKGPPKGSKYLVVDMRLGPDDGKVSAVMTCRFVPAWSYTYDEDGELDEEVVDALDELKPENSVGQLLGHAFFGEEYSCERAFGVAKSHPVSKEDPVKVTKEWRLLFSFDSELDYCWSDSGSLRYFIEETKLAKGEFDRVVSDIESG